MSSSVALGTSVLTPRIDLAELACRVVWPGDAGGECFPAALACAVVGAQWPLGRVNFLYLGSLSGVQARQYADNLLAGGTLDRCARLSGLEVPRPPRSVPAVRRSQ